MREIQLSRLGSLFTTRAYIEGANGQIFVRLLVDTGASFTLLSTGIIQRLGYSIESIDSTRTVVTADSQIKVPVVSLLKFSCLSKEVSNFLIVTHTLPASAGVDGLLGMDFLSKFDFSIATKRGAISIR